MHATLVTQLCFPIKHSKHGKVFVYRFWGNQLMSCEKVLALWMMEWDKKGMTKA